eukprot:COSAG01_NODE_2688_length_7249_cov_5.118182_2_plen_339_part_00
MGCYLPDDCTDREVPGGPFICGGTSRQANARGDYSITSCRGQPVRANDYDRCDVGYAGDFRNALTEAAALLDRISAQIPAGGDASNELKFAQTPYNLLDFILDFTSADLHQIAAQTRAYRCRAASVTDVPYSGMRSCAHAVVCECYPGTLSDALRQVGWRNAIYGLTGSDDMETPYGIQMCGSALVPASTDTESEHQEVFCFSHCMCIYLCIRRFIYTINEFARKLEDATVEYTPPPQPQPTCRNSYTDGFGWLNGPFQFLLTAGILGDATAGSSTLSALVMALQPAWGPTFGSVPQFLELNVDAAKIKQVRHTFRLLTTTAQYVQAMTVCGGGGGGD